MYDGVRWMIDSQGPPKIQILRPLLFIMDEGARSKRSWLYYTDLDEMRVVYIYPHIEARILVLKRKKKKCLVKPIEREKTNNKNKNK